MTTESMPRTRGGARVGVQRFGTFLSGMIMPNIAAFIAWGLITALFIPTGWTPNETLATLVGPMITYLLPLLIANMGGRMIYDTRGGVVATIATMGVIVGTDIPMFLGAMIVGPLSAWIMKKVDQLWAGKIKAGFEMLVDNFSAGILGALLAVGAFFGISPIVTGLSQALEAVVDWLVSLGMLPLLSIFVREPAVAVAEGRRRDLPRRVLPAVTDWQNLSFLREHTSLPIILKGILHPDDATRALDAGMDGVWVSNHGGRQIDSEISSLQALPAVVEAAGGRVPVIFDSGIRGGADAFTALALGATAVGVGRPYVYGLALAGASGVAEVMRNLIAELDITMGLAGVTSIPDITRDALRHSVP